VSLKKLFFLFFHSSFCWCFFRRERNMNFYFHNSLRQKNVDDVGYAWSRGKKLSRCKTSDFWDILDKNFPFCTENSDAQLKKIFLWIFFSQVTSGGFFSMLNVNCVFTFIQIPSIIECYVNPMNFLLPLFNFFHWEKKFFFPFINKKTFFSSLNFHKQFSNFTQLTSLISFITCPIVHLGAQRLHTFGTYTNFS